MNQQIFIEAIVSEVHKDSVDGVVSDLANGPPGRGPSKRSQELHEWYSKLEGEEKEYIQQVIEHAVHSSIFGLLAVLDGVRGIEDGVKEGSFELKYKNNDGEFVLSDESDLHDEYQYQIYKQVFG